MDILSPIWHVLWVHVQGLTSLGNNQYTRIMFIQSSEYPSCGTRFDENCKTTRSYVVTWRTTGHICMLSSISHVLGVWASSNKPETEVIDSDATHTSHKEPKLWAQIWWELQNNRAILRLEYVVTWKPTDHECIAKYSTYLWVYWKGLRSLKHYQYTGMTYIWGIEHPRCRTRFGEKSCKVTMPSSGWCMLLHEEP